MGRHLIIAGHGELRNGTFDPGATGYIGKGEHLYVEEDLFPAMRKYAKDSKDKFIFHTAYKVLDRGNLVALARQHKADTVTEIHFDAFSASSTGGHVIVHKDYAPDALDLRLRDVINDMIGALRFSHRGHKGVDGRTNLGMVNTARRNKIDFRMLELGFGTNKREADIMVNQVDEYARKLIEAYDQSAHKPKAEPVKTVEVKSNKTVAQMADEVIAGRHGTGHDNRRTSLGVNQSVYNQVRDEVNRRAGVTTRRDAVKTQKSISQMASEVIENQHGNGHENRRKSLGIDEATYQKVRAEVNRRAGNISTSKTVQQMAREILNGEHGNGHANRQRSLGIDNATYQRVRARVNQIM